MEPTMQIIKRWLLQTCLFVGMGLIFSGCVTMSGNYTLDAYNTSGTLLNKNLVMQAQGRGIYGSRRALCQAYPKAIIIIKDIQTQEQLSSESPYQCP